MKKHWFLVVMLALISFTACKKENMIIGEWEVTSFENSLVEGDFHLPEPHFGRKVYNFLDGNNYYFMNDDVIINHGYYTIENNTINLESFDSIQSGSGFSTSLSMKISFLSSNKMVWKNKEITKITFKKTS